MSDFVLARKVEVEERSQKPQTKEGKSMDKGPEVETIDTLEEEEDVSVDGEK